MKNKLTLAALIMFFVSIGCKQRDVFVAKKIDLKLDIQQFKTESRFYNIIFLRSLHENSAIAQMGHSQLVVIDLETGSIIKRVEKAIIHNAIDELVVNLLGNDHYIPSQEQYQKFTQYVGSNPIDLQNFVFDIESNKYFIIATAVVFDAKNDQKLINTVIEFDNHLDQFEAFLLDDEVLENPAGFLSGGFLLNDKRLFTKLHSFDHNKGYDFVEFHLSENSIYSIADTSMNINTSKTSYTTRFFSKLTIGQDQYINIGTGLYVLDSPTKDEKAILEYPFDSSYVCLYAETYNEDKIAAFIYDEGSKRDESQGQLLLIDKSLQNEQILEKFNLSEYQFCSMFTTSNTIYLVLFDYDREKQVLLNFSQIK